MEDFVTDLLDRFRVADALDILVVSVLIYVSLAWLRDRATQTLGLVVAVLIAIYLLALSIEMYLTAMIFQYGIIAAVFSLVVVFQQDIRHGIERLASSRWFRRSNVARSSQRSVDTITETVAALAHQRIGALLVFPGREPFDRHVHGGVPVDAKISEPLLLSIFHPKSPGHDGAVLIQQERIQQLGMHLPLSTNLVHIQSGGTRHAAALGLSERCDAFIVVVSEERGTITIAHHRELEQLDDPLSLAGRLDQFLTQTTRSSRRQTKPTPTGLLLKFVSLALAALLWLLLAYETATVQRTLVVPVEYRNLPQEYVIEEPKTIRVQVTLVGSERAFDMLDPTTVAVSLEAAEVRPGTPTRLSTAQSVTNVPGGLEISEIVPSSIRVVVSRKADRDAAE